MYGRSGVFGRSAMRLRWKELGPAFDNKGIRGESVTLVGHLIYCFGGHYSRDFGVSINMNTWSWKKVPSAITKRSYHVAALVDDKIYLYGGESPVGSSTFFDDLIEFDTLTGEFEMVDVPMLVAGSRSCAAAVFTTWRREIVVFGGIMAGKAEPRQNDTVAYHVDKKSWREIKFKGSLPQERTGHESALMGTKMYIYGGYTTNSIFLGGLWVTDLGVSYKPSWTYVKPIGFSPTGRTVPCVNRLQNRLILYGGYTSSTNVKDDLWVFFPEEHRWRQAEGDEIRIAGKPPRNPDNHMGLETGDGVIYITRDGVYKLQID